MMLQGPWAGAQWSRLRPRLREKLQAWRSWRAPLAVVAAVALCCGLLGYLAQATQNRLDAQERFSEVAARVQRQIVERMHRYEYGLRGARGVAVAADGTLTRGAFARYAASRQIDKEFPGARGFGVVLRVPESGEQEFVRQRRLLDSADFTVRTLTPHGGDRMVITFVEPEARNREALGLDIGSEEARRAAAMTSVRTREATLTAPLTLVQASGFRSGGLLLLMPIFRPGPSEGRLDEQGEDLVGWSYAPLLIEEVLHGLDTDEQQYDLSLFDQDHDAARAFYNNGNVPDTRDGTAEQQLDIALYGRRWVAVLTPTESFFASLRQPSPAAQGLLAMMLGGAIAALVLTAVQLVDRTRGQRLEQSRRAAIVEGSADAIVVQTLDGRITDWNEGAERLFGYSRDDVNGVTAAELLIPPGLELEDEALRETVAQGGRVAVFETIRRSCDGSLIPVSITAAPIRDDSGAVVGSAKILRDVREAKAAEQRMRELNATLEDQVRERTALLDQAVQEARGANEAKSRFLANISHEIRTPMNAVIGMTHLLRRTDLEPDQARMLERIDTAGKSLLALLNDVLDLSKIEAGQMTLESVPFSLPQVINQVASIASVAAEQREIGFHLDCQAHEAPILVGDPIRLGQIVLNLLTNAVKFTQQGRVTLSVRIAPANTMGQVPALITVTDSGIGIAPEVQHQLFRPFVQADTSTTRKFGGTGLGLSIVRQLVELMGGTISLRSQVGVGSEFEVRLAFGQADAAALAQFGMATREQMDRPLSGRRILVVDDNELNREVAARLLGAEGAHVWLAANGLEALSGLFTAHQQFDAVLMDVQMPGMDGLQATRRIRANGRTDPGLVILGLTAGVSEQERTAALAAGMDAVVGKPFDPEFLIGCIASHIARRTHHRTESAAPAHAAAVEGRERAANAVDATNGLAASESALPGLCMFGSSGDGSGSTPADRLPCEPSSTSGTIGGSHMTRPPIIAMPPPSPPSRPSPDVAPASWPKLPGLSASVSFRHLGGDRRLLQRMTESLGETLTRTDELLSGAFDANAWTSHAARLHDFKSLAGTLGGDELRLAAGHAEAAIRRQEWAAARQDLEQLRATGRELLAALHDTWPRGRAERVHSASQSSARAELGLDLERSPDGPAEAGDLADLLAQLSR